MKIILIFTSVLLTVNCLSVQEEWISFKEIHGKNYENIFEEKRRFEIFKNNLNIIKDHNEKYQRGESTYYMGINKFTDLTTEEFSPIVLNAIPRNKPENKVQVPKDVEVPDTFDWRDNGVEFPVRDQGKCFAGYAFSSALALDAQLLIKYNVTTSVSVQEIVDCSIDYGNDGCLGGYSCFVYDYVSELGIRAESDYPYVGNIQSCNNVTTTQKSVLRCGGWQHLAGAEDALKWAISSTGPTTVTIYGPFLQHYQGGIFDDAASCPNFETGQDQGILAIGYGSSAGIDYWTLQNSFGADWGERGYLRLKRNPSICGILSDIRITYAYPPDDYTK